MKAWEIAKRIVDETPALVSDTKDQSWPQGYSESLENNILRMKWMGQLAGSGAPTSLMAGAVQSEENMGKNVMLAEFLLQAGFEALESNDMNTLQRVTYEIMTILNYAPKDEASTYWQYASYDDFKTFQKGCNFVSSKPVNAEILDEQLKRAWKSHLVGHLFGKNIRGYARKQIIKSFYKPGPYLCKAGDQYEDIASELLLLTAIVEKGNIPNSFEIAREWASKLGQNWATGEVAMHNIRMGIKPPESGKLNNPYREWQGAQKRGTICGLLAPGDSYRAAALAWRDGEISHANNGIIGEVFVAMLTSLAFNETSSKTLLAKVMGSLPKQSEYYQVVNRVYNYCESAAHYEEALEWAAEVYKTYNLSHVYPNIAVQIIALWFADEDFDKAMEIIGSAGLETSSNAASVATIISLVSGKDLSTAWTKALNESFQTGLKAYPELSIDQIVQMTKFGIQITLNDEKLI